MIHTLFKIIFFIVIIALDGTLLAILPIGRYFFLSIALLILAIYLKDPLFFKLLLITGLILSLFSNLPWYLFVGLILIWGILIERISKILFAGKAISSLLIFYLLSYGLFDLLLLAAHLIMMAVHKEPLTINWFLAELKFAGFGLVVGGIAIVMIYWINTYFDKKFRSWFFIRQ